MIDDKTLSEYEARSLELGCTGNAEILRLARRYLALRESGNFSASHVIGHKWGLRMTGAPLTKSERAQLDAATDRLLEENRE